MPPASGILKSVTKSITFEPPLSPLNHRELILMLKKILIGLATLLLFGIGTIYLLMPPVNIPIGVFRGGIQVDESALIQRINLPDGFRFTEIGRASCRERV